MTLDYCLIWTQVSHYKHASHLPDFGWTIILSSWRYKRGTLQGTQQHAQDMHDLHVSHMHTYAFSFMLSPVQKTV